MSKYGVFSGPYFPVFGHFSPYSVQKRENTDNKKLRKWTFFAQCHFAKKFVTLLTLQFFFEIFLPQPPVMLSTDLHWSITCSFTKKACKFAIKRDSSRKKCQTQNALDKLHFLDYNSEQVYLFFFN